MDHLENSSSFFTLASVISYRNQPFDLQHKSNQCFLYETQQWAEIG